MGGKQEVVEEKKQDSKTEPWAPAQPLLMDILRKAGGISTDVTPGQSAAAASLASGAGGIPQLGPQAANVATNLLGSGVNPEYRGMLGDSLATLKGTLNPFLTPGGAAGNPALRGYLDVARDDVTEDIRGRFAAAGRDFSGAESGAIARGITAAEAPILANQYNADVERAINAANTIYGATGQTVAGLHGLDQQALGNQQAGLGAAAALPGIYTAPGAAALDAANTGYALPFQNLGMLSGLVSPIAGLGAQSSGTTTGKTSQSTDPISNMIAALTAAATIGAKAYTASDIRVKDDIRPIGMLFDDTPVYSFKYKDDPNEKTHVGLMAQDVEVDRPEAVLQVGGPNGMRFVDYERATDRAAALGMLAGMV